MSTLLNRWFHAPRLHTPGDGRNRHTSWLELFYDLIYVAAFLQIGEGLAGNVGVYGAIGFVALLVPVWFSWTGFTFYSNRFLIDDALHRVLVFAQLLGVGVMAVCVEVVFEGGSRDFALAFAFVRAILALLYLRTWLQTPDGREMSRRYAIGFFVGAALWAASAFVARPWVFLLWAVATALDVAVSLSRAARDVASSHPPDAQHLSERYGLLTLIILGASFVELIGAAHTDGGMDASVGAMVALCVVVTFCLWWLYFDDVAGCRIRTTRAAPLVWAAAHLPLTLAVTAVGVAVQQVVMTVATADSVPLAHRWLLAGGLGLALLSVSAIDLVTEPRHADLDDRTRVNARVAAAALILLLAPAGARLPGWLFLALVAGVLVANVAFDLLSAPLAADADGLHRGDALAFPPPVARTETEEPAPSPPRRLDPSTALRRGAPSELRRDLYFHFMRASWTQVLFVIITVFLLFNVFFAALYLLEPEEVSGLADGGFLEAFAFSVQTITTIGYGAMSPTGTYAHVLVTVEAAVGLLGAAVATGLVFAKASRPSASVLFSTPVVITRIDGKPVLQFRAGNARGNDIVEASMRVAALLDEVSAEGDRMRRLHELRLTRARSPIFTLTWSVMHVLDEDSPLAHLTPKNLDDELVSIVVTLTGHDSTYAQTVHARHMYVPDDVRFGHRFVDVLSTLEDGRLLVDYAKFHDTEPQPADAPVTTADDGDNGAGADAPGTPADGAAPPRPAPEAEDERADAPAD